jgi:hypothetical protein
MIDEHAKVLLKSFARHLIFGISRDEARGIDLAIRGLLATFKDDHEVLIQGMVLFDGLYAALSDRP